jgi:transcriptional regulator with XRE-family HTH domain
MMTSSTPEPAEIGLRARTIPRRRGLSLDVAALAGISKGYLSRLETGQRQFERRGLLDDLAVALGCSVADLTGQPYLPPDWATADALATLPGIQLVRIVAVRSKDPLRMASNPASACPGSRCGERASRHFPVSVAGPVGAEGRPALLIGGPVRW